MSKDMSDRVLALAGVVQALAQVRRIADTGAADARALDVAMDSVFRLDAPDAAAVYGGADGVRPGLMILRDYFAGTTRDEQLPRLALAVLRLERVFSADSAMSERVRRGIQLHATQPEGTAASDPNIVAALGALYADTLSHLRPRVLVQGNPHYLGQANVVAEVRAVLLAAIRSAVLWRQLGGSLWDFLLKRREMVAAIQARLR